MVKKPSFWFSLSTLSFALLIIALLGTTLFIALLNFQQGKHEEEKLLEEKKLLADIVNRTIFSPAWVYRVSLFPGAREVLIKEGGRSKDVVFLHVVDPEGTILIANHFGDQGRKSIYYPLMKGLEAPKVIESEYQGEKIKTLLFPATGGNSIVIGFSLARVKSEIRSMLLRNGLFAIAMFLFILGPLFIVNNSLIKDFGRLHRAFFSVSQKALGFRLKKPSTPIKEIEDIFSSFNKMAVDLEKSYTALEESKKALEIKVAARTRELKELTEQQEEIIKERTKELQKRVAELEKFQKLVVGRELKMIELKRALRQAEEEIKKLKSQLKEKEDES